MVFVYIEIVETSAEEMFTGIRAVHGKNSEIEPISGLGQDAYSYIEPGIGPYVVVYDGNLYLSIGWGPLGQRTLSDTDLIDALAAVCQQTLPKLRT